MEPQRTLNDQLVWRSPTLAGQLHFGVISWGSESVWLRVLFSPGWLPAHHVDKMTLKSSSSCLFPKCYDYRCALHPVWGHLLKARATEPGSWGEPTLGTFRNFPREANKIDQLVKELGA